MGKRILKAIMIAALGFAVTGCRMMNEPNSFSLEEKVQHESKIISPLYSSITLSRVQGQSQIVGVYERARAVSTLDAYQSEARENDKSIIPLHYIWVSSF